MPLNACLCRSYLEWLYRRCKTSTDITWPEAHFLKISRRMYYLLVVLGLDNYHNELALQLLRLFIYPACIFMHGGGMI